MKHGTFVILSLIAHVCSYKVQKQVNKSFRVVPGNGVCSDDASDHDSYAKRFEEWGCEVAERYCRNDDPCVGFSCIHNLSVLYTSTGCTVECHKRAWLDHPWLITGTAFRSSQPEWINGTCHVVTTTITTTQAAVLIALVKSGYCAGNRVGLGSDTVDGLNAGTLEQCGQLALLDTRCDGTGYFDALWSQCKCPTGGNCVVYSQPQDGSWKIYYANQTTTTTTTQATCTTYSCPSGLDVTNFTSTSLSQDNCCQTTTTTSTKATCALFACPGGYSRKDTNSTQRDQDNCCQARYTNLGTGICKDHDGDWNSSDKTQGPYWALHPNLGWRTCNQLLDYQCQELCDSAQGCDMVSNKPSGCCFLFKGFECKDRHAETGMTTYAKATSMLYVTNSSFNGLPNGRYFGFENANADAFFGTSAWDTYTYTVSANNKTSSVIVWRDRMECTMSCGRWDDGTEADDQWHAGDTIVKTTTTT